MVPSYLDLEPNYLNNKQSGLIFEVSNSLFDIYLGKRIFFLILLSGHSLDNPNQYFLGRRENSELDTLCFF